MKTNWTFPSQNKEIANSWLSTAEKMCTSVMFYFFEIMGNTSLRRLSFLFMQRKKLKVVVCFFKLGKLIEKMTKQTKLTSTHQ